MNHSHIRIATLDDMRTGAVLARFDTLTPKGQRHVASLDYKPSQAQGLVDDLNAQLQREGIRIEDCRAPAPFPGVTVLEFPQAT